MCLGFDLVEFGICDVPGTPGFLEAFDPLARVLEGRITPFPGFIKDVREQSFSRLTRTLAAWPRISMYSRTCIGAMASIGMCANTLRRFFNSLSLSFRVWMLLEGKYFPDIAFATTENNFVESSSGTLSRSAHNRNASARSLVSFVHSRGSVPLT